MKIIVDADACPVTRLANNIAKQYSLECIVVCDTSHVINIDYATVITVSQGADSADYKIVNMVENGDIVVTQDYGLAALCLSRGAYAVNQSGMVYNEANMDSLLFFRAASAKARRAGIRTKGFKKRSSSQDDDFNTALCKLIESNRVN